MPALLIPFTKYEVPHATLELFCLRCYLPSAVFGDLCLHDRLRRQPVGAEHDRLGAGRLRVRRRHQSLVDCPFRVAAFDHGATVVQALLDAPRTTVYRAKHICTYFVFGHALPDVAVARSRRHHLERTTTSGPRAPVGAIRRGLVACPHSQSDDQPLRPVRHPTGLALPAWAALHNTSFPHATTLQPHATSALLGLGVGVLGDTNHDAGPPAIRRHADALYGRRRPHRGTRPRGPLRRHLSRVPATRAHVHPSLWRGQ